MGRWWGVLLGHEAIFSTAHTHVQWYPFTPVFLDVLVWSTHLRWISASARNKSSDKPLPFSQHRHSCSHATMPWRLLITLPLRKEPVTYFSPPIIQNLFLPTLRHPPLSPGRRRDTHKLAILLIITLWCSYSQPTHRPRAFPKSMSPIFTLLFFSSCSSLNETCFWFLLTIYVYILFYNTLVFRMSTMNPSLLLNNDWAHGLDRKFRHVTGLMYSRQYIKPPMQTSCTSPPSEWRLMCSYLRTFI